MGIQGFTNNFRHKNLLGNLNTVYLKYHFSREKTEAKYTFINYFIWHTVDKLLCRKTCYFLQNYSLTWFLSSGEAFCFKFQGKLKIHSKNLISNYRSSYKSNFRSNFRPYTTIQIKLQIELNIKILRSSSSFKSSSRSKSPDHASDQTLNQAENQMPDKAPRSSGNFKLHLKFKNWNNWKGNIFFSVKIYQ